MAEAYSVMYNGILCVLGVLLLCCLVRAIIGPRIADRVIAINMMGTLIVIIICILSFLMHEGYLVDVALIYVMLSFLGVYREKRRREEEENHAA